MKNFIFISPNFPEIYSHFVKELRNAGFNVIGIGDTPYVCTVQELKDSLTEYCYVSDMTNLQWMKNALDYIEGKYGHIDYLESNNEFWLEQDALLRQYKNIEGFKPEDLEDFKYKSKMKKYFEDAGVKVARYILVGTLKKSLDFVKSVGYPVFAKPDNGVGAAGTYKISNEEELINFHNTKPNYVYIMEEFIDGELMSFDGVCDSNSNVVAAVNETFPKQIANVVKEDSDVWYYANKDMPSSFRAQGERIVKSFGLKKRCFHIEFFKLSKAKKGLGKKGDIIALEANLRCPGGNTPSLISLAWGQNFYKIYAETMMNDKSSVTPIERKQIAISCNRKNKFKYEHSVQEIYDKYGSKVWERGFNGKAIAVAMGDEFFFAVFDTIEEVFEFKEFVMKR